MLPLEVLVAVFRTKRYLKKSRIKKAAALLAMAVRENDITTQAAAYGFEIGYWDKPLRTTVTATPHNPFLDPDWRDKVLPDV